MFSYIKTAQIVYTCESIQNAHAYEVLSYNNILPLAVIFVL